MKIQNLQMRGASLGLRYTRDEDGVPVQCQGDEDGVFDMPAKDAEMLLRTPGWHEPRGKAPAVKPGGAARSGSRAARAATVAKGQAEAEVEKTEAEKAEGEPTGPDLESLRTKAAAIAVADEWRAKGYDIPELDADTMKLAEMVEAIDKGVYGAGG